MSEKKLCFISQPILNVSEEEILATYEEAKKVMEAKGYDVLGCTNANEYDENCKHRNIAVWGMNIIQLANCDAVYFCKGFDRSTSCMVEFKIASHYGLDLFFQQEGG